MMSKINLILLPQKICSLKGPPEGISIIVWFGSPSIGGMGIIWTYYRISEPLEDRKRGPNNDKYNEIIIDISWDQ